MPRSGRPSTSSTEVNIAKVKKMVTENRHLSLREIAAEPSVSHEWIRTISNNCLGMKRVATRLVPKYLNFLQKLNRVKAECHRTKTVFSWYGSGRLFSLSKTQITTSRHSFLVDRTQAEIMTLCRLWRSLKCWSDVGDQLLITNVGTMLENNWSNLIPTVEKVIYRQWM